MRSTNKIIASCFGTLALVGCAGQSQAQYYDYGSAPALQYSAPDPQYGYGAYNQPVDAGYIDAEVEGAAVEPAYFEEPLAPYGQWVEVADYGRCWVPANVPAGWRPYTLGRWAYTQYGWTWVSDEPFGWATYHYGRWAVAPGLGWVWVPGRVWGPAWVSWRQGGGYCGWAPLTPRFSFAMSISSRDFGFQMGYSDMPADYYSFVPERSLCEPYVHRAVMPHERNVTIINNTTNITNINIVNKRVVNHGVDVDRYERSTGRRIERAHVREFSRPAELRDYRRDESSREVAIVRPQGATKLAATRDVVVKDTRPARRDVPTSALLNTPTRREPEMRTPALRLPDPRTAERGGRTATITDRPTVRTPQITTPPRSPQPTVNVPPTVRTEPRKIEPVRVPPTADRTPSSSLFGRNPTPTASPRTTIRPPETPRSDRPAMVTPRTTVSKPPVSVDRTPRSAPTPSRTTPSISTPRSASNVTPPRNTPSTVTPRSTPNVAPSRPSPNVSSRPTPIVRPATPAAVPSTRAPTASSRSSAPVTPRVSTPAPRTPSATTARTSDKAAAVLGSSSRSGGTNSASRGTPTVNRGESSRSATALFGASPREADAARNRASNRR